MLLVQRWIYKNNDMEITVKEEKRIRVKIWEMLKYSSVYNATGAQWREVLC